jgi:hypothetical protein
MTTLAPIPEWVYCPGMGTTNTDIANIILEQLGGARRVSVMIGAKSLMTTESGVCVKFGAKAINGSNTFDVTLEPSDTYRVRFYAIRGTKFATKSEHAGVHVDNLRRLIESETGLRLSI